MKPLQAIFEEHEIRLVVDTFEEEKGIDVAAVEKEIEQLEAELVEVRAKMKVYLKELGV